MQTPLLAKYWLCILLCVTTVTVAKPADNIRVAVNPSNGFLEISNGLAGVGIPWNEAIKLEKYDLAPIQYFIYKDGTRSDNTINNLTATTPPISLQVKMVTQNANEVTVQVYYKFRKGRYGLLTLKGAEPGPGFYSCKLTVKKGVKTVLIEEESDYEVKYSVKISNGLQPDQARYRGGQSNAVKFGYESGGGVYRTEGQRGYQIDAIVDFDYSKPFSYPRLILWEPEGGETNSGRYWQVYNRSNGKNGNLFGIFQGKASRLLGGSHIGTNIDIFPVDPLNKEKNDAEVTVTMIRRGPDASWYPKKRFQWGAFISTMADLYPVDKIQPIGVELNHVSGIGDIINTYLSKPAPLIPAFYKGAIYMPAQEIAVICQKVRTNEAFYRKLCTIDERYKAIWDMWRYEDSARSILRFLLRTREELITSYSTGEGTYNTIYRYWKGALNYKFYTLLTSCLFAGQNINISAGDKLKLEQFVALMARVIWDDNNAPLFDSAGVNFGPANMPFQYRNNGRIFFALLFANAPEFAARAKQSVAAVNADITESIYENGSSIGTPHYTQATMDPILFSMLQLKQAGVADLFRTNPRIKKFALFYASLITPPSCRFSNNRKLISFGDGSEESAPTFAFLATGFKQTDRKLSDELMSIFYYGPPRFSLAGPVGLTVNLSSDPDKIFSSTSASYTGYVSGFRSAVNTTSESALWVLNGNGLYDHRNDDEGEVAIYALGAPLSVSRSSFYYPSATDARIRGVVIPESMFPQWKEGEQPIAERSLTNKTWPRAELVQFASLGTSSTVTVRMSMTGKDWYRNVYMINPVKEQPIIVFYDSVTGKEPSVWSLPLMTAGPVKTPAGLVRTRARLYEYNGNRKELPQANGVTKISSGINQFTFSGQDWSAHPAGGIDCRLITASGAAMDFNITEWGTTWQNTLEQREFLATNRKTYEEQQQFVRLTGREPFFVVLLPYNKGANPYGDDVKRLPGKGILINTDGRQVVIDPWSFGIKDGRRIVAGVLREGGSFNNWGLFIKGGCSEVEYNVSQVRVRVHGNSGKREVHFPFIINAAKNYMGVQVRKESTGSVVMIDYKALGKDLQNGVQGLSEYEFIRK